MPRQNQLWILRGFLVALENKVSSLRQVPFNVNEQQDAAEMLEILLEEFKGNDFLLHSTSVTMSTTFTCDTCLCDSSNEERLNILQVPPSNSVQTSIEKLLESEHLENKNMRYCPSCSPNQPTSVGLYYPEQQQLLDSPYETFCEQ